MNKGLRLLGFCLILTAFPCAAKTNQDRAVLVPKLSVGQTFHYQVSYRAKADTTTESTVAAPMAPTGGQTNASLLLQVEVDDLRIDAGRTVARFRTRILEPDRVAPAAVSPALNSGTNSAQTPSLPSNTAKHEKIVEFVLHGDGQVTDIEGLDKLSSDEQAAWQEWVARFGGSAAFPERGIKPGEKWKAEEPIPNALLSGLSWEKESEYVNDAPCGAMSITPQGDLATSAQSQETCAVILTTATLKQSPLKKTRRPKTTSSTISATWASPKAKTKPSPTSR